MRIFKHAAGIILLAVFILFAIGSGTTEGATISQQSQLQSGGALTLQQTSQYWTGDGGSGIRLGILVPRSQGLNENQEYLPAMVQGVLVANVSKYSAISVLDRVSLDRVIAETLDPTYEDDLDIVRLGHVAQVGHMMTGNVIRTSTGYSLQINVTNTTPNANTIASYSGTCTVAELDDHSAIQRASLELLSQMNVQLTSVARDELNRAGSRQSINAQTALAQGITAQQHGTEVAALSYFFQAAELDPTLLEAANRSIVLSANITSGNIGADVRNDIQWRRDWVARLTATEESFYRMINAADPPYSLFYSTAIEQGRINYQTETVDMSIPINLHGIRAWFNSVQRALQDVYDGLNATRRKSDWGLGNWPEQGVSNTNPFGSRKQYDIVMEFELVNASDQVIGRQTITLRPTFSFSGWGSRVSINYNENDYSTVSFNAVRAEDITNNLRIRIVSVNRSTPENTRFQITALTDQKWQEYRNGLGLSHLNIRDGVLMGFNPSLSNSQKEQYHDLILPKDRWGDPFIFSIADNAFGDYNDHNVRVGLTSVKIPYGVTSIGQGAFRNNLLTSIEIPNSVNFIGFRAFNMNRLTSVIIPDNITIEDWAFATNRLTSITIGSNVRFSNYVQVAPFDDRSFLSFYNDNGRKAGTYTRSSSNSSKWSFMAR